MEGYRLPWESPSGVSLALKKMLCAQNLKGIY